MIFANLEYENLQLESVLHVLLQLLDDKSTMVKVWTILRWRFSESVILDKK
jgi:hypothetical protein